MAEEEGYSKRQARKYAEMKRISFKEQEQARLKAIKRILKKPLWERTKEEESSLQESSNLVGMLEERVKKRINHKERLEEIEDPPDVFEQKCAELAEAIHSSKYLVVYTGAGISTAARIPDYRGPCGVWTMLQKGKLPHFSELSEAEPTYTHMALAQLQRRGLIKHVVSQNCDGLHLRSGFSRNCLSEVHGNMFVEVCTKCKPLRQYFRLFDVTEKTGLHKHHTGRRCHKCNSELIDTIVHFGEKGKLRWPLNWQGAGRAADKCDTILCLGSSLKVLRRYKCLWGMDRSVSKRPKLYIVNLQWTPKDDLSAMKINGRCDEVLKNVMANLGISVTSYNRASDPIFKLHTPLRRKEFSTFTRKPLEPPSSGNRDAKPDANHFQLRGFSDSEFKRRNQIFLDHCYAKLEKHKCHVSDSSEEDGENSSENVCDSKKADALPSINRKRAEEVKHPEVKQELEDGDTDEDQTGNSNCQSSEKSAKRTKLVGWYGKGYGKWKARRRR